MLFSPLLCVVLIHRCWISLTWMGGPVCKNYEKYVYFLALPISLGVFLSFFLLYFPFYHTRTYQLHQHAGKSRLLFIYLCNPHTHRAYCLLSVRWTYQLPVSRYQGGLVHVCSSHGQKMLPIHGKDFTKPHCYRLQICLKKNPGVKRKPKHLQSHPDAPFGIRLHSVSYLRG